MTNEQTPLETDLLVGVPFNLFAGVIDGGLSSLFQPLRIPKDIISI